MISSRTVCRSAGSADDELQPPAIGRVCEGQPRSVQERTLQPEDRAEVCRDASPHSAIQHVADDRVTDPAQVDPNLMRASRVDRDLGEGNAAAGAGRV